MTQTELAEKCGVTQQAISQYESGAREPDLDTLKKLSSILECSLDELLKEDPDDEGTV